MPFAVRPTTPPPPPPVRPPHGEPKRILWTSAAGDTIDLSTRAGGYAVMAGRDGFGRIDAELVADRMTSGAALLRAHRLQPRVMTTPLLVEGATEADYLAHWRRLQASLRHPVDRATGLPVPGRITVELPDGSARSISAFYQTGGSATEDNLDDVLAHYTMLPNLQWYAAHPIWQGADFGRSWQVAPDPRPFYPIYPMRFTSSQVLSSATITNPGDADAYGVWTIVGPGTPSIGRTDTGEVFAFSEAIPAGRTVTVDCRPVELAPTTGLTVVDDTGEDWWDRLVDFPDFWTLPPGKTHLDLSMTGANADSRITLAAAAGWQGAW